MNGPGLAFRSVRFRNNTQCIEHSRKRTVAKQQVKRCEKLARNNETLFVAPLRDADKVIITLQDEFSEVMIAIIANQMQLRVCRVRRYSDQLTNIYKSLLVQRICSNGLEQMFSNFSAGVPVLCDFNTVYHR